MSDSRIPMSADEAALMTKREHDDSVYVKAAGESLTHPSDYAHFGGDDGMFEYVGQTLGHSRDSDTLEESNYQAVLRDLSALAEFLHPGEGVEWVYEHGASHWLVGWVENVAVRVLVDPTAGVAADNLTPEFIAVTNIAVELRESYPVYDESHYSDLESEAHYELWTNCTWPDFKSSNSEDDRAYENDQPGTDVEYLDSVDIDALCSEVGNYASEDDPGTWTDEDIWAGVVRLAERSAYES